MRVSVITVCFNSQATIGRTIESVLGQTSADFEYIIIDGASGDRTLEIAEGYRERFVARGIPYRIYSGKDSGIYDAMDKGIGKAEGEIVGIVNSDDWYEPDAVGTAIRLHDRECYDVCMCALNLWRGDRRWVKRPKIRQYKVSRDLCHPSMFVTLGTYRRIGLYSRELFYGDFDFWLRLFKRDVKITVSDQIVTNYAMGGVSNQKTIPKMVMRIRERYKAYRNNGYSKLYLFESVFAEAVKMILA